MNLAWPLTLLLGLSPTQAAAPGPAPAAPASPDTAAFHAVVLKLGPRWDRARSVREQPGIREHGEYMSSLSASGVLVLGGPFMDDMQRQTASGAIVFFATADAAEARRLMEADPGVAAGLFEIAEVKRFVAATGSWRPWKRP
jgi:uncharacterized protein YciI